GIRSRIAYRHRDFRKRDELVMVVGRKRELAGLPGALRFVDSVAAGRNEIPPDVALSVHRRPAAQHEPSAFPGLEQRLVAWREEGEMPRLQYSHVHRNVAVEQVQRAFVRLVLEL